MNQLSVEIKPTQKSVLVFSTRLRPTTHIQVAHITHVEFRYLYLPAVSLPTLPASFSRVWGRLHFLKPLIWWLYSQWSLSSYHTAENSHQNIAFLQPRTWQWPLKYKQFHHVVISLYSIAATGLCASHRKKCFALFWTQMHFQNLYNFLRSLLSGEQK